MVFPDTVFYKDGVAQEIIKTDPDTGLITSVKQESKLTWEKVTQNIITVVRDRRRFVKKANKLMHQEQAPEVVPIIAVPDLVVVRYHADSAYQTRVANEREFS